MRLRLASPHPRDAPCIHTQRGAGLALRLRVNVTNCADGRLEFSSFVNVGGLCPASANPSYMDIKHPHGRVACPP